MDDSVTIKALDGSTIEVEPWHVGIDIRLHIGGEYIVVFGRDKVEHLRAVMLNDGVFVDGIARVGSARLRFTGGNLAGRIPVSVELRHSHRAYRLDTENFRKWLAVVNDMLARGAEHDEFTADILNDNMEFEKKRLEFVARIRRGE